MSISRRDLIKGLGSIPVLGLFGYAQSKKKNINSETGLDILAELNIYPGELPIPDIYFSPVKGDTIKVGIIGNGYRGKQIFRALGYAQPDWVKNIKWEAALNAFQRQQNLKIQITAVCDTFSVNVDTGTFTAKNAIHPDGSVGQPNDVKGYEDYRDLISDPNVDAVMILTPDHWHAKMAIDAIKAGKHVYLEKPMTRTAEEALELWKTVKNSNVVFQLGHQNRQQVSHIMAEKLLKQDIIGKVSLIETSTNRNSPHGAWIRNIHPEGNKNTINWDMFLGDAPRVPFNADRYFNWQKWFEYGTSVAGNQFTHYYDAINQVIDLGIPRSVVASGGNYFYKDERNIPDVFHAVFEYPEKELSLTYSASLANSNHQGKLFRGNEGTMDVGDGLIVEADQKSERYKKYVKDNKGQKPLLYSFDPSKNRVDAVASATAQFYNKQGVMYTYVEGDMVDVTHLHIKEWLECIRNGGTPKCNIDEGLEESVTFRMANVSYLEGRKVEWDPVNKKIV